MLLLSSLQDTPDINTVTVVSDDTVMQYYHDSLISQQGHHLDPQLFLAVRTATKQ
jgi:hypothetical protein